MKKYLRVLLVTLVLSLALLVAAAAILFHTQHLSFYNSAQAQARFGISRRDLALIRHDHPAYVWAIPQAGRGLNLLRQPAALIGVVYLPALAISLYEIRYLAGHRQPGTKYSTLKT